jgi:hypothetical protein
MQWIHPIELIQASVVIHRPLMPSINIFVIDRMCWNQSVSLNTFLFGLFAVSLGLYNKVIKPLDALGAMSFISMQLIEFFTWRNLGNKETISFLSKISLGLILSQPLLVNASRIKTIVIPLAYIIGVFLFFTSHTTTFSMHKADNGHLSWTWLPTSPVFIVSWMLFFLLPFFYTKEYLFFFVTLIISLISLYTYYKDNTWGSMWCWIANIYSIYLLYLVFSKDLCLAKPD